MNDDLDALLNEQNATLRLAASKARSLRELRAQKADLEAKIKVAEDECEKASRAAINATQTVLKNYGK